MGTAAEMGSRSASDGEAATGGGESVSSLLIYHQPCIPPRTLVLGEGQAVSPCLQARIRHRLLSGVDLTSDAATSSARGWRRLRWQKGRLRALGRSQLARDHIMTLGTEFSVTVASFLLLKLAAAYAGPAGFGEFVLGRRLISFVQLPALCGMALALSRSVAMARGSGRGAAEWMYLDAALAVTMVTSAVAGAALLFGGRIVATAAMGGAALTPLAHALAPCVAGLILHCIAYALLRGRQAMVPANILQGVNIGVVPLAVFAVPGLSIPEILCWTGVAQIVVSSTALAVLRARGPRIAPLRDVWNHAAVELLRYGTPRVPGEFMLGALSALPVAVAAHYGGAVEAGRIGLGMTILTLFTSTFAPLGQVMLPSISRRVAAGDTVGLARGIWLLAAACAGLTAIGVFGVELIAPWLLPAVFGPAFAAAVVPARIIILGAVPHVLYVVLRNVLDAIHAAPLNTLNLFVALAAFGGVLGVGRNVGTVPYAVLASSITLGALTAWRTLHALKSVKGRAA
jgi:O-antigen/teichoic acid export membrane protein